MRRIFYDKPYRFVFIPFAVAAFVALLSYVVMQLWNNILPDVLHVATITYWQAMGIFVLCKILFGFGKGHRGGGNGGAPWMRKRMEERFKNMSHEEREKFKKQMENRMCGPRWGGRGGFGRDWNDFKTSPEEEKQEPQS